MSHYYSPTAGPSGFQIPYLPAWDIPPDDSRYLAGLKSVITELAAGNSIVIRGRGSQFILKDHPGSLHILTLAPLELRIMRVMRELNVNESTAKKEIASFDSSRREFIKRYFNAELENPVHYDLVINTERLNFDSAASIVVYGIHQIEQRVPGEPVTQ
jgi:cytidylate kinase